MLEVKWPQKYNHFGHVPWAGRVYGPVVHSWLKRWTIDHGVWGSSLFQCMYAKQQGVWQFLPLMPEWYLLILALALITIPGAIWTPLVAVVPLLLLAIVVPVFEACLHASAAPISKMSRWQRLKARTLITMLHLAQPLMRLRGRLFSGLTIWGRPKCRRFAWPMTYTRDVWSEHGWRSAEQRLESMEGALYRVGARVVRGGPTDRWDLEIGGGIVGRARVLMAIEEHGGGKQMIKLVCRPTVAWPGMALLLLFTAVARIAGVSGSLGAAVILGAMATCLLIRTLGDCSAATASFLEVVDGSVASEAAAGELNRPQATTTRDLGYSSIGLAQMYHYIYNYKNTQDSLLDNLRIGTTWASVTATPGDVDGDGDIDDADLGTSFSNYTGPAGGKSFETGDTDGDGDVDDGDLGASFSNYTGPLAPTNIPEPASAALLIGGALLATRRRR